MLIPNVSICSIGSAKGHDLEVDATLLSQLQAEIHRKKTVQVKLGHRGGMDTIIGWIQNARLGAGKLIGDLELCKSSPSYNFVRELVSKFSTSFGLSPSFVGAGESLRDGRTAARCRELLSVDLVESPASNPTGLFEAEFNGSLIAFESRPAPLTLVAKQSVEVRHLQRCVDALSVQFDAMQKRQLYGDDDEEQGGHSGGTNVGHDLLTGGVEGAGSAVLIDGLLHGEGNIAERLASVGRSLKNPIGSGLPKKAGIGLLAGSLLTASSGLLISKLASDHKKKQAARRGFVGSVPETQSFARLSPEEQRDRSLYRVAGFRHKVAEDEISKAASSYTKAGATGALAGGLIGSLHGNAKIGAGIGALASAGSILAIRKGLPADQYGQHTPEEGQVERIVPIVAGITAAVAAKRKLNQVASRTAENIGRGLARGTNLFA